MKLYFFPHLLGTFPPRLSHFSNNHPKECSSLRYTGRYSHTLFLFSISLFDFVTFRFTATSGSRFPSSFLSSFTISSHLYSLRNIFLFCIYLLVTLALKSGHPFFSCERETYTDNNGSRKIFLPGMLQSSLRAIWSRVGDTTYIICDSI